MGGAPDRASARPAAPAAAAARAVERVSSAALAPGTRHFPGSHCPRPAVSAAVGAASALLSFKALPSAIPAYAANVNIVGRAMLVVCLGEADMGLGLAGTAGGQLSIHLLSQPFRSTLLCR